MPIYSNTARTQILAADGQPISDSNALATKVTLRNAKTIQTHNAVSVAANGKSVSAWIDGDGFENLAITLLNDATTSSRVDIWWSNDGTNHQATDSSVIPSGTSTHRSGIVVTKARYFKVSVFNEDDLAAHTMSAWAYLKC
jgi:hypothetical protein